MIDFDHYSSFQCTNLIWLGTLCLLIATQIIPAENDPWSLVWSDEFEGGQLDLDKWNIEVNAWGGGNNELQFYTDRPENIFVEDGKLVLRAIKEQYTAVDPSDGITKTRSYTSGRINSKNRGDWLYGRFEISAKLPGRQGLWPAIWMLPTDWAYGNWAASGEIDIMENRGDDPNTLINAIHYGGPWPNNAQSNHESEQVDLTLDFHTYILEWERNQMRWYFDDQLVWQTSGWYSTAGDYPAPFDKRFHLLLNVAVGGNFLTNPPPNADYFPREMQVDYVRVYQFNPDQQTPWNDQPLIIPGRLEAEYYDIGGSQVAYNDSDQANNGNLFRTDEEVDIEHSNDSDGTYSIGWFPAGEWVEYTIVANQSAVFDLNLRYATNDGGAEYKVELRQNGETIETLQGLLPGTGGWSKWASRSLGQMMIPSGEYILRVSSLGTPYNFNYLDFEQQGPQRTDLWIITGTQ